MVTNPETVAALRFVLEKFSDKVKGWRTEIPAMPWAEADAVEMYLYLAEKALHDIIAEITKP